MKTILALSILLCAITSTAMGALDDTDLDKIRLIVKEEIKTELDPINRKIDRLETRTQQVEKDVASLTGRIDGIEKLITWLIVITVAIFGIPQFVVLWRNRTEERELKKQVETLTQEIENSKNGRRSPHKRNDFQ